MEDASIIIFIAEILLSFSPNPELCPPRQDSVANGALVIARLATGQPASGPSTGRPITGPSGRWHHRVSGAGGQGWWARAESG